MIKAFVDASVIYASLVSSTGAARELLKRRRRGEIQLIVSEYVLDETISNLKSKNPNMVGAVGLLVDILAFDIIEVDAKAVNAAAEYTEMKDAPVVAAAIAGDCTYLLTFDRQHLLNKPEIASQSGLVICTAGDLLQVLRENE